MDKRTDAFGILISSLLKQQETLMIGLEERREETDVVLTSA